MRKSKVVIAFLVVFYAGVAFGDDKKIILSPGVKPGGNYSQGILINGTFYISGQGGEDTTGKIPGDFDTEIRQCLDNIGTVLKAAGMSPADVVSVQVYLTDVDKFERMNAVYTSYFKEPRPTRTPVVVARLVGPGNIEITLRPGSSCTRRGARKEGRLDHFTGRIALHYFKSSPLQPSSATEWRCHQSA